MSYNANTITNYAMLISPLIQTAVSLTHVSSLTGKLAYTAGVGGGAWIYMSSTTMVVAAAAAAAAVVVVVVVVALLVLVTILVVVVNVLSTGGGLAHAAALGVRLKELTLLAGGSLGLRSIRGCPMFNSLMMLYMWSALSSG